MDAQYARRLSTVSKRPSDADAPTGSPSDRVGSPSKRRSSDAYSDRYIPIRNSSSTGHFTSPRESQAKQTQNGNSISGSEETGKVTYNLLLQNELLGAGVHNIKTHMTDDRKFGTAKSPTKPVLKYSLEEKRKTLVPGLYEPQSPYALTSVSTDSQRLLLSPRRAIRKISKIPFKVLDAPDLQDDFYLNLVDWSSQNVLCVGLGSCVYLWSACTSQVTKLCDLRSNTQDDVVTSVKWMKRGSLLAIGTNRGFVQIWDAQKCHLVRTFEGHTGRVGALAWASSSLSSGSRDRKILQRDIRGAADFQHQLLAHKQEVCGLEWSPDEQTLASGGNDNKLFIWSAGFTQPRHKFNEHIAAVKAIAWSPHQHGLLASGGGTADQCIRFWNTLTHSSLQCVETKSQVCNLAWSKNGNELVSTHGYSQNQIILWKYPSMTQIATLTGHTYRVLYLAMSPDGQTIVTGAGDETLRFWNVFSKSQSPKQNNSVLTMFNQIR